MPTSAKIVPLEEAARRCDAARGRGERVALANGLFDLLHVGHVRYLEAAKGLCDLLVVAVNADGSVVQNRGRPPVIPGAERAELVAALAAVDLVLLFEERDVSAVLRALRPNFHVKGTDYAPGSVPERELVASLGGQVVIAGDPKDHSSSALRERWADDPAPEGGVRLSGVVVAQDEAHDLPECLERLAFCDEIVVVDGGSHDRTVEIARAAGARVFERPWPGYGAQRQRSLGLARGEWILAVDADERVEPELRAAVLDAVKLEGGPSGYRVRVQNELFGRPLRHGGVGRDYHVRLYRREAANYEDRLHAGAQVEGAVGTLPGALLHPTYADLEDYLGKLNRYTSALARERHARGARFSPTRAALRLPWGFGKRYLMQLGFLDGYPGFAYAALSAYYDFLKLAKLRDVAEAAGQEPQSVA